MSALRLPRDAWAQAALGGALLAFSVLCYRTAWLSDDAVISLRTAHNWLEGYGMRWNIDERVQSFTHPLWFLLLTAAHAITGEPFFSTLYLSWIVSTAAVAGLLFACPGTVFDKLLALTVLAFSQSFVDFSSSGLENPFTHLCIVAFVVVYTRDALAPRQRALWLSLIAGLAAFNRLDSAALFVPALVHVVWRNRREAPLRLYLVGAVPLAVWELFALIYYGFPFPNTAYAKLSQDQGNTLERWLLGLRYLENSWLNDPITLAALVGSAGLCLWRRDKQHVWLWLGAFAYVLYTISVGGDFMTGRFLSAPLCMSMACLTCAGWLTGIPSRAVALALVAVLACSGRFAAPFMSSEYKLAPGEPEVDELGIHNERRMFFDGSSLLHADRMAPSHPDHRWASGGRKLAQLAASDPAERVQVVDAIGYAGYYAGPGVHIVDPWALADALIARLPPVTGQYGHYSRVIPRGYVETLRSRANHILDPSLASYYSELHEVISGPIWSPERLRAIWRIHTGQLQDKLEHYAYVRSPRLRVRLQVRNPGDYAGVISYVWNDGRTSGVTLARASKQGDIYDVEWEISADKAQLIEPQNVEQTTQLPGLRPHGIFTVSVAFTEQPGTPLREVHELRYRYNLRGDRIDVQRQPWPAWNADFPDAPWREERRSDVLGLESTTAAP
jgi:arabinofuranosyltransferase